MRIRQATREDNAALCALESRTPIDMGSEPLIVDRTNFFSIHDLQERTVLMLAEEDDGEIVGVCAGALVEAPLAGKKRLLLYIHHERIAPDHQRKGIGGALTGACSAHWKDAGVGEIESSYWYISPHNRPSRAYAERTSKPWPVSAYIVNIDAAAAASEETPRRVGAGPIFDIVRLVNRTHAGKELFQPYEQVDFGQRLARSPDYGWGDVYGRHDGGALVAAAGVWDRGKSIVFKHSFDDPGSRGWSVADYGHEAGAECEMAALLQALCAQALRRGRDTVSISMDVKSDLYHEIEGLKHSVTENLFYAPRLEAPASPAPLYQDPVYY